MINTLTIITKDYSLLAKSNEYINEKILFSFEINSLAIVDNKLLHAIHQSTLLNDINSEFSFFIYSAEAKSINENIYALLQYFFHPKYAYLNDMPILCFFIEEKTNSDIENLVASLNELLINQGYKGFSAIYFSKENKLHSNNANCFFSSSASLDEVEKKYFELLNKYFYTSRFIGIEIGKEREVILKLQETEKKTKINNSLLFNHLENHHFATSKLAELSKQLSFTKVDLANQKTYLQIFIDADEALKINEFYRNEYEVLPLWYKKFGHLIKVIMGKRTFRSLFDNNVKKYKN